MSAPTPKRSNKKTGRSISASIANPAVTVNEASSAPARTEIRPDEIARLAYSYWEARGGQGGSPEEDWLRAEQQLRAAVAAGM